MIRIFCVLLSIAALVSGMNVSAQVHAEQNNTSKSKPKKVLLPQAYLGKSDFKGGPIKREQLNDLLKQGITSRDSAGKQYKVAGFEFGYAERMLYEDSAGNLVVMVDYLTEYCPGTVLTPGIQASIYDRFKPGDTVYIERVSVVRPRQIEGNDETTDEVIAGKGMKIVITR